MLKELDIKAKFGDNPQQKHIQNQYKMTIQRKARNLNSCLFINFEQISPHIQTVYDEQYSPVLNYRGRI